MTAINSDADNLENQCSLGFAENRSREVIYGPYARKSRLQVLSSML